MRKIKKINPFSNFHKNAFASEDSHQDEGLFGASYVYLKLNIDKTTGNDFKISNNKLTLTTEAALVD